MTDFLLELRSEEIPARMQAKAREDLARLFAAELDKAGLKAEALTTYATPRRLALIARGLPTETAAVSEEIKGPRVNASEQALQGFLRKNGLSQDQLVERDGVLFAIKELPGQSTTAVLSEAVWAICHGFPWPKSMRWGEQSKTTTSLRWVRPLSGIIALFGDEIVSGINIDGIEATRETVGHRFHSSGMIAIQSAETYADQLRDAHVIVDQDERAAIIALGAKMAAQKAGLVLVEDEGLLIENAGLTEWPVPLLGRFDAEFLSVPPEVIQLTARVNQKYFVCKSSPSSLGEGDRPQDGGGAGPDPSTTPLRAAVPLPQRAGGGLANAFICTANIDAADGGERIVEGNRKVLAARLSDARFFYETDLKVPLEEQAKKLEKIVFHEKLGTVADKVDRVAKLARWLVEEGIVTEKSSPPRGEDLGEGQPHPTTSPATPLPTLAPQGRGLADLAERAARLCKADLVTGMVGEFPELQGVMGGYYAAAQGEDPQVAAAIRDHYKPVGQGGDVPTDPVTVAVSLADKLDTLGTFFLKGMAPTGSRDPFALRRAALGCLELIDKNRLRVALSWPLTIPMTIVAGREVAKAAISDAGTALEALARLGYDLTAVDVNNIEEFAKNRAMSEETKASVLNGVLEPARDLVIAFFADRLKVQQREAGVRHDLIDAVFALGGEDDLVRLLARVHALQSFIATEDGANLLAGYKRAANILKKEGFETPEAAPATQSRHPGLEPGSRFSRATEGSGTPDQVRGDGGEWGGEGEGALSYTPEIAEAALIAALDAAEPAAAEAVAREDFEAAMAALATLRAPIDAFFDTVTVNDPDPAKRAARLALLARVRTAVHAVADFSRIEG